MVLLASFTVSTTSCIQIFLHIWVCLSRCLSLLNIVGTILIAIRQSEIMYQCTYIWLCLKLNRRVNFDIHGIYNIKLDDKDRNDTQIALISLLIYNIICELCNVIIRPINKIVLVLFKIHPMSFLYHVHNMLYIVRTLENNLPCYYFNLFFDLYLMSRMPI